MKLSFVILFFLVLSGPGESQDTKFPGQKNRQERETGNQQKSETGKKAKESNTAANQSPVSLRSHPPEISQSTSGGEKDRKENNPRNWFDWYVAFGPATWSQWALTVLAAAAAFAAFRTLRTTQQSLRISERAWVTVKFDMLYKLGDPFVAFHVINTGKTPGHIKQSRVLYFDPADRKMPIPWVPGSVAPNPMDTVWSIAPGESLPQRWNVKIDEIEGIADETKRLTTYGFILYDDIFGKRHRTTFYRIFSADTAPDEGVFIIPPETEAQPGQNEAT